LAQFDSVGAGKALSTNRILEPVPRWIFSGCRWRWLGYCADGHRGPRCELCDGDAHTQYFDKLHASCNDCGDITAKTMALSASLLLLLLAGFGFSTAIHHIRGSPVCDTLLQWTSRVQTVWRGAGARFKVKVLVGFYQCLSAVPRAFNVEPPVGLEEYARWINLIAVPSELENIFVPTACLGDYPTHIWGGSTWPLLWLLLAAALLIGWQFLQACLQKRHPTLSTARALLLSGLQDALPLMLGFSFVVVPSTSTRLFRTFRCATHLSTLATA
jgi:hypothetical protein